MFDLSKNKTKLFQVKLEDGTILKIKNPSQKMFMQMLELAELNANDISEAEALTTVYEFITSVFNRNTNGIVFTQEQVEDMIDIENTTLFIEAYLTETGDKLKN